VIHPPADEQLPGPYGAAGIVRDLRALGLAEGDLLIAHVSLRSLGWVSGGPVALLRALSEVLGPEGGVVVPTFTSYLCDPSMWVNRRVPQSWWSAVRAELPGFDPHLHASQPGLGRFPEVLRSHPGAVRSDHPLYSLAALGQRAAALLDPTPGDWTLGVTGPLARFVDAGGKMLSVGIPWWSRCTLFHLAEHRAAYRGRLMYDVPARARRDGRDVWLDNRQLVFHDGDFAQLGKACAGAVLAAGNVGAAPATVLGARTIVTMATGWLARHRDLSGARLPHPYQDARPAPPGEL
jgi:aminoglycoside 3-N-acetyltransferase